MANGGGLGGAYGGVLLCWAWCHIPYMYINRWHNTHIINHDCRRHLTYTLRERTASG